MKNNTIQQTTNNVEVARNPAESYKKTLFNYDLEIANTISRSEFFSAREEMYRDDKTKQGKKTYFGAIVNLRKLQVYLNALKKGKNEAWSRLEQVVNQYKPKRKQMWFMYFINGYSIQEIAEMLPYDPRNLRRIIKAMKEELVTYLTYEDLEDKTITTADEQTTKEESQK